MLQPVPEHIHAIPSMGGREIGHRLAEYAAAVPSGQTIVEVGVWLGAGTAHLALGTLRGNKCPIHCYDRWRAQRGQVAFAKAAGCDLRIGQDLLPLVRANLKGLDAEIHYHQGNVSGAVWSGEPIGMFVDDATKANWDTLTLPIFAPSWVAGAVLVLMDYHFDELAIRRGWGAKHLKYRAQKRWARANADRLELLEDRVSGTDAAIFRYRGH